VGKTTLALQLIQEVLHDVSVEHMRFPRLLPRRDPVARIEARLGKGGVPDPNSPRVYPQPYRPTMALAKTLYLFVDWLLGWAFRVRPVLRRGGWIVMERGWWDQAVDGRRYRLRPGSRLPQRLGRLLPVCDLVVVIEAPPEVVLARKPQLSADELTRQMSAWRSILPSRQERIFVDGSAPPKLVLEEVRKRLEPWLPSRAMGHEQPERSRPGRSATSRRNSGPWVLIADGSRRPGDQGRSAVAAVRALGRAGYRAAVTVTSGSSLAAASRYCDRRVPVPSIMDTDAYRRSVGEELARNQYLTSLPASDAALRVLAGRGADLLDKFQLEAAVGAAGLRMPPSLLFDSVSELRDAAREFEYPVVVKPSTHRQKPQRITSPEQLSEASISEGGLVVQPYLSDPIRSVSGLMWKGELLGAVHSIWLRKWRLDCGNASAAETVGPDAELELRIATLLKDHEGVFNTQFIGPYLLDVHPRVYGTHSLAVAAGVNQIALYCDLLRGLSVNPPPARQGVRYRWAEADFKHLFSSVRAGRVSAGAALGALRPRRGTAHSTESLTDPGPMLARVRYGLTRGSN